MQSLQRSLFLIIGIITNFANSAIYSGSRKTSSSSFDFRYPDIIINPRPNCPSEGVFPHPKNCTWFYRCFSFYKDFYHRAYFQCEPGTIFDDDLDQCIAGSPENCKNAIQDVPLFIPEVGCANCKTVVSDCKNYIVCPGGENGNNIPQQLRLCRNAVQVCSPCNVSTNLCNYDQVYSQERNKCYENPNHHSMSCQILEPPPPLPPDTCAYCSVHTDSCRQYEICLNGGEKQTLTLCAIAFTRCMPCGVARDICPKYGYYAVDRSICFPAPSDSNMICQLNKPGVPANDCKDCYVTSSKCKQYRVCPSGGSPRIWTLCRDAKTNCDPCGSQRDTCAKGLYFAAENGLCYPEPESSTMSCHPVTPSEGSVVVSETTSAQISCSKLNLIPSDEWIRQKFCSSIPLCINGEFVAMPVLCTFYYKCKLNEVGKWEVEKKKCPIRMLFEFDKKQCTKEPSMAERCQYAFLTANFRFKT